MNVTDSQREAAAAYVDRLVNSQTLAHSRPGIAGQLRAEAADRRAGQTQATNPLHATMGRLIADRCDTTADQLDGESTTGEW